MQQVQKAIFDSLNIKVQDSDLEIDSSMQFNQYQESRDQVHSREHGTLQSTVQGTMRTSPVIPSSHKRGPGYDPPLSPVGLTASQFNIQIRKSKSNLRDSPSVKVRQVPSPGSSKTQTPVDLVVNPLRQQPSQSSHFGRSPTRQFGNNQSSVFGHALNHHLHNVKNMQELSFAINRYEPCFKKIKNINKLKRKKGSKKKSPVRARDIVDSSEKEEEDAKKQVIDGMTQIKERQLTKINTAQAVETERSSHRTMPGLHQEATFDARGSTRFNDVVDLQQQKQSKDTFLGNQ